jgi:hypothetical protein
VTAFVAGITASRQQEMNPMAQYLMSVLTDSTDLATDEEMAAISAFNEQELIAAGHWVFAGGLGAPDTATVVDGRQGEAVFTDGPYLESKEFIIGFWIIEADDLDVALRLSTGASKACNRRVELRPVLGR